MKFDDYIKCLQASSFKTGDLQAFYNKNSGISNPTGDYFYNLKYPPSSHLIIRTAGDPTAVDTRIFPGRVIGTSNNPVTNNGQNGEGYFNGGDLVQVGYEVKFPNWSAILDISPDLCDYTSGDYLSRIIFSTMESPTSTSGFYVGINQGNKLYVRYKNEEGDYSAQTLNKELNKNSIIGISQVQNAITLGLYDLEEEELDQVSLNSSELAASNRMYLGNFGNNTNTQYYRGYCGFVNNFALFGTNLSSLESISSCQCMFSTGVDVTSTVSSISVPNITGFEEVPQYITGVTGYKIGYKNVTDDGVDKVISYEIGLTGLVSNGVTINMLTGTPTVTSTTGYFTGAFYDQEKLDYYSRYYLNFKGGIKSGESIEILSFDNPREDIQLSLNNDGQVSSSGIRLYNYGLYRQSKNDPSYMTRGEWGESGAYLAAEGAGHDYDYTVLEDKSLSGFVTDENSIIYDLIDTNAICIDYSGYWGGGSLTNSAVWGLYPNKVGTGAGGYFPPNAQFLNHPGKWTASPPTPGDDKGQVIITGVSGRAVWNDHIYYNGQKLIENIDFFTGNYETGNGLSIDALVITGGLLGVSVYGTHSYDGIINTPNSFYTPEMCFVPKVSGEKPSIMRKSIEGCSTPPYCSDSQHLYQLDCEAVGICSNSSYNNDKATCLANGLTWTQTNTWYNTHGDKALCESKGGTWEGDGIDGIPDPLSGFSEMVWLNGIRLGKPTEYRKGKECSLTKSFTFFDENPFVFYNNDEEFLNYG